MLIRDDEYSWNRSIRELWETAAKNPTEVPHYQKLVTLARLKEAHALAIYTKWLMVATVILALSTAFQIMSVFLHR